MRVAAKAATWVKWRMFGMAVAVLVVWYTSGLAYLCSVLMAHQNAQIAAVSATVVCGGFLNGVQPRYRDLSKTMRIITGAFPLQYIRLGRKMLYLDMNSVYRLYS